MPPDAIVIGGGLAGIAAAIRLADRGVRVTLVEATRRLGGRATSHIDPDTGEEIDNCQHVSMGACTAYNALLSRLGMADAIEWTDTQTWLEPGGRASTITPGTLPAPLHYAGSFAAARFLSALDKAAIASALPAIALASREDWKHRTFLDFLHHAAQPESTVRRFWSPVVVSACNLDVQRVSAAPALMVFQRGLLAGPQAARIGVPRVPLGRLYQRVGDVLAATGGRLELGRRVAAIEESERGVTVHTAVGHAAIAASELHARPTSPLAASFAVIALPPHRVLAVLPPGLRELVPSLRQVEHSTILGVHLRADRPILSCPHAVLLDRSTHWLFRKDDAGRLIHAVISAAPDTLVARPESEIARQVWADIIDCIPAARDARLIWSRAIKSRLATFAATPEFESARPSPGPLRPGCRIALAGDYTHTGWPATMEGATRSGQEAANAMLA